VESGKANIGGRRRFCNCATVRVALERLRILRVTEKANNPVVVQFQRKPKIAHKTEAVKTMANSTAPVILMSLSLFGVGFFTLKIRHTSAG